MINTVLVYLAVILFAVSIIQDNGLYRATGFFVTFCLLAIAVATDLAQIFISIMAGMAVHLLTIFSIKETR